MGVSGSTHRKTHNSGSFVASSEEGGGLLNLICNRPGYKTFVQQSFEDSQNFPNSRALFKCSADSQISDRPV